MQLFDTYREFFSHRVWGTPFEQVGRTLFRCDMWIGGRLRPVLIQFQSSPTVQFVFQIRAKTNDDLEERISSSDSFKELAVSLSEMDGELCLAWQIYPPEHKVEEALSKFLKLIDSLLLTIERIIASPLNEPVEEAHEFH